MLRRKPKSRLPIGPLSIHDPVFCGRDESGDPVLMGMAEHSVLFAGSPDAGKSAAMQVCIAHGMLCRDVTRSIFLDAKQVELGMWEGVANEFIGPDVAAANTVLKQLQTEIDRAYADLKAAGLRKQPRGTGGFTLLVCDELAFYTSVNGTKEQQKDFATSMRDIAARGRAAGIIPLLATQRPSSNVIPTDLRDLIVYRAAFSVVNDDSSDVILGNGWASEGYTAASIPLAPEFAGVCLLRSETSIPRKVRWAYLPDTELKAIITTAHAMRHDLGLLTAA